MRTWKALFVGAVFFAAGILSLSCSKDKDNDAITSGDSIIADTTSPEWLLYYHYVSESADTAVFTPVYSTRSFLPVDTLVYPMFIIGQSMKFTQDVQYIVWGGSSLSEHVWTAEVKSLDTVGIVHLGIGNHALSLSANDQHVVTYNDRSGVGVYSMPNLDQVWKDTSFNGSDAEFLGTNRILFSVEDDDSTLYIVDFINSPEIKTPWILNAANGTRLTYPTLAADQLGGLIYVGGYGHQFDEYEIQIFDMASLTLQKRLKFNKSYEMSVSPSGKLVFLHNRCDNRDIYLYNRNDQSLTKFLDTSMVSIPKFRPDQITVSPDDSLAAIVVMDHCDIVWNSEQGNVILVEIATGQILHTFEHNSGPGRSNSIAFYPISK